MKYICISALLTSILISARSASAQVYFLNQNEEFIRSEIKKEYLVENIENGVSKEVLGSETPTLSVKWGAKLAVRDGNLATVYYFKNGKCFLIKELYWSDEQYMETIYNRFKRGEKQGLFVKKGEQQWTQRGTNLDWAVSYDGGKVFALAYGPK